MNMKVTTEESSYIYQRLKTVSEDPELVDFETYHNTIQKMCFGRGRSLENLLKQIEVYVEKTS